MWPLARMKYSRPDICCEASPREFHLAEQASVVINLTKSFDTVNRETLDHFETLRMPKEICGIDSATPHQNDGRSFTMLLSKLHLPFPVGVKLVMYKPQSVQSVLCLHVILPKV